MRLIALMFLLPSACLAFGTIATLINRAVSQDNFWLSEWNKASVSVLSVNGLILILGGVFYAAAKIYHIWFVDLFAVIILLVPSLILSLITASATGILLFLTLVHRRDPALIEGVSRKKLVGEGNYKRPVIMDYESSTAHNALPTDWKFYVTLTYVALCAAALSSRLLFLIWMARAKSPTYAPYLGPSAAMSGALVLVGMVCAFAFRGRWPALLGICIVISCIVGDIFICMEDKWLFQ